MIATTIDLDPLVFEENVYEDYKRKTFGPMFIHAGINNAGLTPRDQKGILYYLKRRANFLLFLGNPGLGKTHLCAALTYWAHTYFQSQRYWTEASIHKELIRRQGEGRAWQAELDEMMDYEFLFVDDVGRGKISDFQKSVFTELVDYRYKNQLPTIITSNLMMRDFAGIYHERVASRLKAKGNIIIEKPYGIDHRREG
jgi:DNA replication protein DnaC